MATGWGAGGGEKEAVESRRGVGCLGSPRPPRPPYLHSPNKSKCIFYVIPGYGIKWCYLEDILKTRRVEGTGQKMV
jgi:hypothetical protein